jgi:hypothetical protein
VLRRTCLVLLSRIAWVWEWGRNTRGAKLQGSVSANVINIRGSAGLCSSTAAARILLTKALLRSLAEVPVLPGSLQCKGIAVRIDQQTSSWAGFQAPAGIACQ